MAQDVFTEVTTQSWFSRIKDSVVGVLFGLLLFAGSFFILWMNEGRAVKTADALREVGKTVIPLTAATVSPQNDGKLIYVTGTAKTEEMLSDDIFPVPVNSIKLQRDVEMYQWVESSKSQSKEHIGGSKETRTTYTYKTQWSGRAEDSSSFKQPDGHANPAMAYSGTTVTAQNVALGQFLLSQGLIAKIDPKDNVTLHSENLANLSESIRPKALVAENYLYIGAQGIPDPAAPKVGDYRIRYRIVPAAVSLSIISRQISNTFEPYRTKNGRMMELLETGTVSAETMVANAQKSNQILTWVLRLVGFLVMFFGLGLIFKPLSTLGAIIPIVGQIMGAGAGAIAFFISLALSLLTIGIAWFFYRPLLSIALFAIALLAIVMLARRKKPAQPAVTQ